MPVVEASSVAEMAIPVHRQIPTEACPGRGLIATGPGLESDPHANGDLQRVDLQVKGRVWPRPYPTCHLLRRGITVVSRARAWGAGMMPC